MSQLKHIQSTLGWFLVGLLMTYVLINIIGFVSPFWALWMYPEVSDASRNLLDFWQPITPWFSVCFVVAAWHLSLTARAMVARVCIVVMGVIVPIAYIGSSFTSRAIEQTEPLVATKLPAIMNILSNAYLGLATIIFISLIWRAVRQTNNTFTQKLVNASS